MSALGKALSVVKPSHLEGTSNYLEWYRSLQLGLSVIEVADITANELKPGDEASPQWLKEDNLARSLIEYSVKDHVRVEIEDLSTAYEQLKKIQELYFKQDIKQMIDVVAKLMDVKNRKYTTAEDLKNHLKTLNSQLMKAQSTSADTGKKGAGLADEVLAAIFITGLPNSSDLKVDQAVFQA